MACLGIGTYSNYFCIQLFEFFYRTGKINSLGCSTACSVFWIKIQYKPFAFIIGYRHAVAIFVRKGKCRRFHPRHQFSFFHLNIARNLFINYITKLKEIRPHVRHIAVICIMNFNFGIPSFIFIHFNELINFFFMISAKRNYS